MAVFGEIMQSVGGALAPVTRLVCEKLGLPLFAEHAGLFYVALAGFTLVQGLTPYASRYLFPNVYLSLPRRTRYMWTVRVVSMVHALIILPWAAYLASRSIPSVDNDKAFGWDPRLGDLHAVAAAYFLWDTVEATLSAEGLDFVIHGATTLFIYGSGYRPWVAYYGPRAILWELSTPFLNIHWFLDKAGKTGSTFQLVNGVCLLASFAGARLCYGLFISYDFLSTLWSVRNIVSPWIVVPFALGNVILSVLNYIWFYKMINAIRKRFDGSSSKKTDDTRPEKVTVDGEELLLPKKDQLSL